MAMKSASESSRKTPQRMPQDPAAIRSKLRKTKLCSFFQEGRCRRGDDCAYAHAVAELEAPPDLTKTLMCVAWKSGTCPNTAANCRYAHGKSDLRVIPPTKSKQDGSTPLLARPPGLQPPITPATSTACENAAPPPVWPSGRLPMKVVSPTQEEKSSDLMPMKVVPNGDISLFSRWRHWESETMAGESSSDDDGSHSSIPIPSSLVQPDLFMKTRPSYTGGLDTDSSLAAMQSSQEEELWGEMMTAIFDISQFEAGSDPQTDVALGVGAPYSAAAPFDMPAFDTYSQFGEMRSIW